MFLERERFHTAFWLVLAGLVVLVALASSVAFGRYVGTPVDFTPEQAEWIRSLRVPATRSLCCDQNDGDFTSQDIRTGADGRLHWWATVKGTWYEVPDDAVLPGPNTLGRPLVFYIQYRGLQTKSVTMIRCFLPGALG